MSQISRPPHRTILILPTFVALCIGCGTAGIGPVQSYDAATAASKAIETYDHNGDGKLSADEIESSAALAASKQRIDRNGDGILTAEEIQMRLEEIDAQSDYIGLDVTVSYKGRPLVGAELTLTPEPFMGAGNPIFTGITVEGGGGPLVNQGRRLPGIPPGFYEATIVHTGYGINEVKGYEISDDATGNRLRIVL